MKLSKRCRGPAKQLQQASPDSKIDLQLQNYPTYSHFYSLFLYILEEAMDNPNEADRRKAIGRVKG